eukprot:TRINITY_DN1293_c0_g1_i2.p1 TRINITY_DN1293_c0_g1~~TRINITY_DN1293_c0_g1_i2.p1  ORF type:complete len:130 (+),score=46.17 TRINITY_DN1293_c0_g1_i2:48-437(+)
MAEEQAQDVKPDASQQEDVKPAAGLQLTLSVKSTGSDGEVHFKIKSTTKMGKVFTAYASRKGLQVDQLRFMSDGKRIKAEDTPADCGLEDGDQLDCMMEAQGGSMMMEAQGGSSMMEAQGGSSAEACRP